MACHVALFDEVQVYLDLSLFPGIIATVLHDHSEDEDTVLSGVQILSTIAQSDHSQDASHVEGSSNLLVKGDAIECLCSLLYTYQLNSLIVGHSVYILYLLSHNGFGGCGC